MITVQNPATLLPLQELKSVNTQTGEEVTVAQLDLNQIRVLNHLVKDDAYTDNTGNDYISVDFPMPVNKYSFKINVNASSNIPIITDVYITHSITTIPDTVPTGSISISSLDFNNTGSAINVNIDANSALLVIDTTVAGNYLISLRSYSVNYTESIQNNRYYKVVEFDGAYQPYAIFYGTNGIVSGKYYFTLRDVGRTDSYANYVYISTDLLLFSLPSI